MGAGVATTPEQPTSMATVKTGSFAASPQNYDVIYDFMTYKNRQKNGVVDVNYHSSVHNSFEKG